MLTLEPAGEVDARRLAAAGELFGAILSVAKDARRQQWLHRDTADALDRITELAELGAKGADEDEADDFPP